MNAVNLRTEGFTLVELITVILLLGIVSSVVIARSGNSSDFEPRKFASTAAEQYRFAHGLSAGRYGDLVSFSISNTSGTWQFVTASLSEGEVRREAMADESVSLLINNGTTSLSASTANSVRVEFAPTGDVSAAYLGTLALQVDLGIELSVTGGSTHNLCIYPTGYLSVDSCE